MSEPVTVKLAREQEIEQETQKARERTLKRMKERDAVSEGFKTHTKGEKFFNDLTYTGFGYFGVTGLSVFMTWLIKDTEPLKTPFKKLIQWSEKNTFFGKRSNSLLTILTLFTGGSLMTVTGVKALEDNKSKLVKWFDKQFFYGKDAVENNPELIESHKIIESQPKQTWASVGLSRVVAFAATIGSWILIGENKGWIAKKLNTSIDTMGTQFGRWSSRQLFPKLEENIHLAVQSDSKTLGTNMRDLNDHDKVPTRVFSYIGTDGLYTVITSIGLFISTRILAPIFDKTGLDNLDKEVAHQNVQKPQTAPILTENLERAEDDTAPRVRVEKVASVNRLAQHDQNKDVAITS
jgi:hypothetical protein